MWWAETGDGDEKQLTVAAYCKNCNFQWEGFSEGNEEGKG
jgi:hypothetical protein